jgi:hypothetical protein
MTSTIVQGELSTPPANHILLSDAAGVRTKEDFVRHFAEHIESSPSTEKSGLRCIAVWQLPYFGQ